MADQQTSRMIDVTGKTPTRRTAAAEAEVHLNAAAREALAAGTLPKGRAEDVARVAGILAAKRCADLIPFCHPIGLNHAEVRITCTDYGAHVRAVTRVEASTGVEMEALTAVSVAALTIYDMCKALDPSGSIQNVRVTGKRGGKTGAWGEALED